MREETAEQILDGLFSFLEDLETQSAAILQFLKDKGIASDEELKVGWKESLGAVGIDSHPCE